MTRTELAKEVSKRLRIRIDPEGVAFAEMMFIVIGEALARGEPVVINGFGTLKTLTTPARPGYDPGKRRHLQLPPMRRVRFDPTPGFKLYIRGVGDSPFRPFQKVLDRYVPEAPRPKRKRKPRRLEEMAQ